LTKKVEEEKQNKDVETRNNDAQPMDTDIPEISTTGAKWTYTIQWARFGTLYSI
jgi:hypothetical protein